MKSVLCLVTQSYPTLCDPIEGSLPGFSVHRDSPGKNTGVGCYALLQGIFPTQGLNPGLPHCRQILYCLSHEVNTSLFFCSCCCSCGPGSFFIWLLYPFDILPLLLHGLLFSCFYALPCFLTLQDALG